VKSIEFVLLEIKENPEKYLGEKSFTKLNLFEIGYRVSRNAQWGFIPYELDGFQEFLYEKYQTNHWVNGSKIVQLYSSSDEDAFDKFYELWDEFTQLKESGGIT
jgi:hypothetical protein